MKPLGAHQDTVLGFTLVDAGLAKGEIYLCGCGEEHEAGDVVLEVSYQGQVWNTVCLIEALAEYRHNIHEALVSPQEINDEDISPLKSPNGIWWCGYGECAQGYSKLQDSNHYCVKAKKRINPGENAICLLWLKKLVELGRK